MGSSAFLLPLEPRGLYREMLTQAWRRGGKLPNDPVKIRRAIGVTEEEWHRCWPQIERYWTVRDGYLVNETQIEVYAEAEGVSQRALVRSQRATAARHPQGAPQGARKTLLKEKPPSPTPTDHAEDQHDPHADQRVRFETFWAVYPRKIGKDAAWKEWLKRSPSHDLSECMIAAVERHKASPQWRKEGGQFIPHPRTWLHQGRWQDELEPAEKPYVSWRDRCHHDPPCESPVYHDALEYREQKAGSAR